MKLILSLILAVTMSLFIHDGVVGIITLVVSKELPSYQTTANLPPFLLKENGTDGSIPSSALIRIHDDKGNFRCSGSIISSKYVLTAAHCLVDSNRKLSSEIYSIKIYLLDGSIKTVLATAAALNNKSDYGLMLGDFSGLSTFKIAIGPTASLTRSINVATCGYPYGTNEPICYATDIDFRHYNFQLAVGGTLYPGMSGGPVYDLEHNVILGVNSRVDAGFIVVSDLVGLFETLNVDVK